MRLDDTLLQQYMVGFCGYGDHEADYWLVGLEEGSTGTMDEIASRLNVWHARGCPELDDLVGFHEQTGLGSRYFGTRPRLQATWGRLIRVLLAAQGSSPTREQVRQFQATELGRIGGSNSLMELFPLPACSTGHWPYSEWSSLPHLRERRSYHEVVGPARLQRLLARIKQHCPKLVLCYGLQHRGWWERIAPLAPSRIAGLELATAGPTLIGLIPHPTFHGVSNAWLESVGAIVCTALSQN